MPQKLRVLFQRFFNKTSAFRRDGNFLKRYLAIQDIIDYMIHMKQEAKKTKWDTQLRKGALELVILAVLRNRELYGLEILETLKTEAGFLIPSGTIYPLLDRMKREGLLTSRWVHSDQDRPRKYYKLTKKGQGRFKDLKDNWAVFTRDIEKVLGNKNPSKRQET